MIRKGYFFPHWKRNLFFTEYDAVEKEAGIYRWE